MGPKFAPAWTLFEALFQTNWSDFERRRRPAIFDLGDRANRPVMPVDVLGDVNQWLSKMTSQPERQEQTGFPVFGRRFAGISAGLDQVDKPRPGVSVEATPSCAAAAPGACSASQIGGVSPAEHLVSLAAPPPWA